MSVWSGVRCVPAHSGSQSDWQAQAGLRAVSPLLWAQEYRGPRIQLLLFTCHTHKEDNY